MYPNQDVIKQDDSEGSVGGSGGSGEIKFRDFLSTKQDPLSPAAKKQKLTEHANQVRKNLLKAKEVRENRKLNTNLNQNSEQYLSGGNNNKSEYKSHPILSKKQQFDGIDPKINLSPVLNVAETNEEKKAELKYQQQLTNELASKPHFAPKLVPM